MARLRRINSSRCCTLAADRKTIDRRNHHAPGVSAAAQ
jgi:hypothetical protein